MNFKQSNRSTGMLHGGPGSGAGHGEIRPSDRALGGTSPPEHLDGSCKRRGLVRSFRTQPFNAETSRGAGILRPAGTEVATIARPMRCRAPIKAGGAALGESRRPPMHPRISFDLSTWNLTLPTGTRATRP